MSGIKEDSSVSMGKDDRIDPYSQLFRSTFVGVETGPMISQVKGGKI